MEDLDENADREIPGARLCETGLRWRRRLGENRFPGYRKTRPRVWRRNHMRNQEKRNRRIDSGFRVAVVLLGAFFRHEGNGSGVEACQPVPYG